VADSLPTAPLGVVSNSYSSGWWGSGLGAVDALEHIPDLTFPRSVEIYRKLRSDATVSSSLKVYNTPLTKLQWRIDPRGASDEAVRVCADSLGLPVLGMDQEPGAVRRQGVQWGEHLRLALQYLVYGFMPFEPIYEVRADGYAYLTALPERLPSTITGIEVNDDGSLKHITQAGRPGDKRTGPKGIEIPGDRLLWYVHEREGAVWTGRSFLRECYSPWLMKWEILRTDAIGLKRFGAGTVVMVPNPGTNPTEAQITRAQQLASSVRVGETGGAVLPGFTMRILGVEGTLPDAMPRIRYYDEQMSRSVLASVLDLGSTNSGNRALGDTFSTLLADGVQSIGNAVAGTATDLCRRLIDYNFGPDEPIPAIVCSDVKDDPQIIAGAIGDLVAAGVITPGPELEAYVREAYGLPAAPAGLVGFENEPEPEPEAEPAQDQTTLAAAGGADAHTGPERKLIRWYVSGEGAAKIRWGTAGDFDRCRAIAGKYMPPGETAGFCANRHKEATGQWPGKGRMHAAEGDPSPYRAPTPAEQAAGIDPAAIDEDHDALVSLAQTAVAAAVAAWVATATTALASAAAGGLLALARATFDLAPDGVAEALKQAMGLARRAGVEQALGEAQRAGAPKIAADDVSDDSDDSEWADMLAERGAGTFEAMAKRAAEGSLDEASIAEAIDAMAWERVLDAMVHDAINHAMLGGRLQAVQHVIDATPGTTWHVFHSGIRDQNQCEPCAEHDGTEYPDIEASLVDFGLGRYRACLGMSRCRCIVAASPIGALQFGDPAFFRGQA
jgi:hypothetical protein